MPDESAPQDFTHWLIEIGPVTPQNPFPLAGMLQLDGPKLTTLPRWPGAVEIEIDGSIADRFTANVGGVPYTFERQGGEPDRGTASGTVSRPDAEDGTWSATAQTGNT